MKNIGVLLVESQPPHAGEFLQARQMLEKYDYLYICILYSSLVMDVRICAQIWASIFQSDLERMTITFADVDFKECMPEDLPALFTSCTYLTSDKETFVHLSTMNVDVELIPNALGYYGIFLRNAYRQSKALNWLEMRFINQAEVEKIKR